MGKTTIEVTDQCKDALLDHRLETESSYEDTLWRLLDGRESAYATKQEAREIANEQITERVVREAQK